MLARFYISQLRLWQIALLLICTPLPSTTSLDSNKQQCIRNDRLAKMILCCSTPHVSWDLCSCPHLALQSASCFTIFTSLFDRRTPTTNFFKDFRSSKSGSSVVGPSSSGWAVGIARHPNDPTIFVIESHEEFVIRVAGIGRLQSHQTIIQSLR